MSLLAETFWATGRYPWEVLELPLRQRAFVIAAAVWKNRTQRADAGDEGADLETAEDQLERVRDWSTRFGGLEMSEGGAYRG